MKFQTLKGYSLAVVSGAFLIVAILLCLLQWGNVADFSFFGKNAKVHTIWLMFGSLAAGMLTIWMCKIFIRAAKDISAGRRLERLESLEKQASQGSGQEK